MSSRPHNGRPEILSPDQKEDIVNRVEQDPFSTAVSFAREYGVTAPTITSVLKKNGLRCRTAATQTKLTEQHCAKRIAFCRTLLEEWDDDKLRSIIFSDEKTFCSDVSWRSKVYRPDNCRHVAKYVQRTARSGRITNYYWGAIGCDGPVTDLVRIEGKFNASKYMSVIRSHVIPMMDRFEQPCIFMQDNSPVHKAGRVMSLLSRQQFEVMEWPPLSPDLNPIENVWSHMIRNWPTIHPRRPEVLDAACQERWTALRDDHGIAAVSPNVIFFKANAI